MLAQGFDQIKTLAAHADTQTSGLLFRFLFTTAAHGGCGQTATGERQQAQSSVEGDGGAAGSVVIATIGVAHHSIIYLTLTLSLDCTLESRNELSIWVATSAIGYVLPRTVKRHGPQNHRCKEGPEG